MANSGSRKETAEILARSIQGLIREASFPEGSHLPETFFAQRLKVSRTPVRAAFLLLEEKGVVRRRPNRGYFLVDAERQVFTDLGEPHPIPPLCFTLGTDYLNGRLGRNVTEAELAKRYVVGRNAVRQALQAMEGEGWVHRTPGYGWEFGEFLTSADTYDQCFRFRLLIEPAALREPGYNVDRKVFEALRQSLNDALGVADDALSERQMYLNGTSFHERIVACSNNRFFLESLQRANRLRRLIEYHIYARRESPKPEYEEHLAILDLLEAGENDRAAVVLARHLERARRDKVGIAREILAIR